VTGYGLDGPRIESWWGGRIFHTCPDRPQDPPSLLYNGYRVFPWGKDRAGRDADPHPLLVPWSRKSRAIPILLPWAVWPVQSLSACTGVHFNFTYTSTPPMGHTACTEPQCLYRGALYLYLYLYSSYGPYGLYRASVHVQRCTLSLPIPLLLPWAVRPVQSLSACTTVHFTFTYTSTSPLGCTACTEPQCLYRGALYLYFYSPYAPHGLYRASVHVQQCTLSLPIPLLLPWAVRPVQSLSACTGVHFTFTYISTPPMGRTACTVPQCLYNSALYLYLYSPYGPYGLYRASVHVQRCTLLSLYLYSSHGLYGLYRASVPVHGCTLLLPFMSGGGVNTVRMPECCVHSHTAPLRTEEQLKFQAD